MRQMVDAFRQRFRPRPDAGAWIVPDQLLIRSYPRSDELPAIAASGIRLVINLEQRPHNSAQLKAAGLTELHLPVPDFTPPTPTQIDQGVAAISTALANDQPVLVHCAAGKGRSGSLVACYLVQQGQTVSEAIAEVRRLRPGAIENARQERAIDAWSRLPGRSVAILDHASSTKPGGS